MYNTNDYAELYHHGILGQKWGVRRFQRKDGSLTKAGLKRMAKLEAKSEKIESKKKALTGGKPVETKPKKKSINEMTLEELKSHTTRMTAEKNYLDAKRNLQNAMPHKETAGDLVKKYVVNTLLPSARDAAIASGKKFISNQLKELSKSPEQKEIDRLTTEQQLTKLQADIAGNRSRYLQNKRSIENQLNKAKNRLASEAETNSNSQKNNSNSNSNNDAKPKTPEKVDYTEQNRKFLEDSRRAVEKRNRRKEVAKNVKNKALEIPRAAEKFKLQRQLNAAEPNSETWWRIRTILTNKYNM